MAPMPSEEPPTVENIDEEHRRTPFFSEESTAKRPRLQKGLSTSPGISKRTGLRARVDVNYDTRFHPADRILRPNYPATKAAQEKDNKNNSASGEADDVKPEGEDGRNNNRLSEAHDLSTEDGGPGNFLDKPNIAGSTVTVTVSPHRLTRSGRLTSTANYDMKYHPMDASLRPKIAAKRIGRAQSTQLSLLSQSTPDPENVEGDKAIQSLLSVSSKHENSFINRPGADWAEMSTLDRRLFQLQEGLAPDSKVLPMAWVTVFNRLKEEKLLSRQQLSAIKGCNALEERYGQVWRTVFKSFEVDGRECVEEEEVQWMQTEDIHVHGLSPGERYWSHRTDCLIHSKTGVEALEDHAVTDTAHTSIEDDDSGETQAAPVLTSVEDYAAVVTPPREEDALLDTLRSEVSALIEPLMDEGELGEVWNDYESQQQRAAPPSRNETNLASQENFDEDDDGNKPLMSSEEIVFSLTVPPGTQYAARRMSKEKRRFRKGARGIKRPSLSAQVPPQEAPKAEPSLPFTRSMTPQDTNRTKDVHQSEFSKDQAFNTPNGGKRSRMPISSPGAKENVEPETSSSVLSQGVSNQYFQARTSGSSIDPAPAPVYKSIFGSRDTPLALQANGPVTASATALQIGNSVPTSEHNLFSSPARQHPTNLHATVRRARPRATDFM